MFLKHFKDLDSIEALYHRLNVFSLTKKLGQYRTPIVADEYYLNQLKATETKGFKKYKGRKLMKSLTLNLIKKNRKYFACKTPKGYNAKLLIDNNSQDLELGEQELLVIDDSVRSKYGVDLKFKVAIKSQEKKPAGICTLKHFSYNQYLVEDCKNLGGKWDSDQKAWIFNDLVEDKVDDLDDLWNSEPVVVEIGTTDETVTSLRGPVSFCGYTIARAYGRDSGAVLGDDVALIDGRIDSGGSMKNWTSRVRENSRFRLRIPQGVLDKYIEKEKEKWPIIEVK